MLKKWKMFMGAYYDAFQSEEFLNWKKTKLSSKQAFHLKWTYNLVFLYYLIRFLLDLKIDILTFLYLGMHLIIQLIQFLFLELGDETRNSLILEILTAFQQINASAFILFTQRQDFCNFYLLGIVTIVNLGLHRNIKISFFLMISNLSIFFIQEHFEGIFLFIVIQSLFIIKNEEQNFAEFNATRMLYQIISGIPQAMCLVNCKQTKLLFANDQFNKLASSFNYNKDQQLKFLNQLKLTELNKNHPLYKNYFCQELLKIKRIIFNTCEQLNQPDRIIKLPSHSIAPQLCSIEYLFTKNWSLDLNLQKVERQTFTTEIMTEINVHIRPSTFIQTAFNRKQSDSIPESNNLNDQQLLQMVSSLEHSTEDKPAVFTKNLKFIVDQIKCKQFVQKDEILTMYFISDLTPYLLKNKIKKLDSIKRNLMRSISHELLTYLNGALGYIDQLGKILPEVGETRKFYSQARKCMLLQIFKINDLTDFRDIQFKRFQVKEEKINLTPALNECIDLCIDQMNDKNLTLDVRNECLDDSFVGDSQRFSQLLLNLLTNAIKFTKIGGITLTIRRLNLQVLEIMITDSGIGMEEEQLSRLIKKVKSLIYYVQLQVLDEDEKVSKESVGIGLGLAVCREILLQMGPTNLNLLFVESKKDFGSAFYFYLKRFNLNAATIPITNFYGGRQKIKKCTCDTILIVDDEQFNLNVMQSLISLFNFKFELAYNGEEALEKVKGKFRTKCCEKCCLYPIIFMDLNMPKMTGWKATQEIRNFEEQNSIKMKQIIIALSGFSMEIEKQKCLEVGMNYFLSKPATKEKLKEVFTRFELL